MPHRRTKPERPKRQRSRRLGRQLRNLILLCAVHHKLVDDQPHEYTPGKLRDVKAKHEAWVQTSLSATSELPKTRILVSKGKQIDVGLACTGAHVADVVTTSYAYEFSHPEPSTEAEAELIGQFLQEVADLGEVYNDIGPLSRTREKFRLTEQIDELAASDLFVFVGQYDATLEINSDREAWPTAVVKLVRSSELPTRAGEHDVSGAQRDGDI